MFRGTSHNPEYLGAVNPTSAETPVMDNAGTSANHEKRNTPSDSVSNISVIGKIS